MTDKQIIIDGVDVSGCSLYEDNPKYRMWGTCDCMRSMVDQSGYDELAGAECKGYNCYYKQLKRKEQECETLASQLDFEVQKKECLEQECEELGQAYLETNELLQEKTKECTNLKAEIETLKSFDINLVGVKECEIRQLVQYRKTLTEIKDIAEETINSSDCYKRMYGGMCARPILQKISECEVGR